MSANRPKGSLRRDKKLVLVVDDDLVARELVCDMLVEQGLEVVEASNGSDALDLLLCTDRLPGLILLDLDMPVMSGWDFLFTRRAYPQIAAIPVVITSASGERARSKIGAHDAVLDCVPKPLDLELLRGKILAREQRPSWY